MGRKVVLFGLLVVCSLGLLAARAGAGVIEKWQLVQRVRWTSNTGERGSTTYVGELWVTVSGNQALTISSKGSPYLWDGAFTAANQPWRDNSIKANHLVFDAVTPGGDVLVGRLRPNRNWTRLTGKIAVADASPVDPALSWLYEITVTATYIP